MAVKSTRTTGRYVKRQLNLLDTEEWRKHNPPVTGMDVFHPVTGRVREEWISACKEERVLTRHLLGEVADYGNLEEACRKVISNRGSAGIDGMETSDLRGWFNSNVRTLSESLINGSYCPQPVREVEIPKVNGGVRKLGIPTVVDRLVQQAIHQVLSPRYELIFSEYSYGFRPKRSAHDALFCGSEYIRSGHRWIVDIDLEKFFDQVNHHRLMWLLSCRIGDNALLSLIHRILKTGIFVGGLVSQRVSGTPQGGPLSPLLSNIVLDELDKELERRGHKVVRYADDLRIFVRSQKSAHRVMESVTEYIEKRLRLRVNREKSQVCKGWQTNFLGHSYCKNGNLCLSRKSEERFKAVVKKITSRRRGISLEQLLEELNLKLRGWLHYFQYSQMTKRLSKLTGWLRHRIRCFRLKQCKRAKGIVRFLKKLGVPTWRCWLVALSGKGWWRLSATPQAQEGMNLEWFKKIGLFDLDENYQRLKLGETAVYLQVRTVV
jgi:group II intron reverse transcriptase/maturase